MKYYSDITKKLYDSEKELMAAEQKQKQLDVEKELAAQKKEEERKALMEQRKARAAEIDAARKDMEAAQQKYRELVEKFCKDYGAYHYTSSNWNDFPKFLDSFFNWL